MKIIDVLGQMAFWCLWPLLYLVLNNTRRTRVLVVSDNAILVIKGWIGDGKWALPGGGIHKHESPKQSVVRELAEETGLKIASKELIELSPQTRTKKGITVELARYVIEIEENIKPSKQLLEVRDAQWIPLKDLHNDTTDKTVFDHISAWQSKG